MRLTPYKSFLIDTSAAGLSCPPPLTTTSTVHPPEDNGQREKVPLGASEPSFPPSTLV